MRFQLETIRTITLGYLLDRNTETLHISHKKSKKTIFLFLAQYTIEFDP